MQVLTDLKPSFPNPENPALNPANLENLENPAHILKILLKKKRGGTSPRATIYDTHAGGQAPALQYL